MPPAAPESCEAARDPLQWRPSVAVEVTVLSEITTEVVIIGAGPCGLFQVFELGLLGISAHVVDSLQHPGGQCAELYPEKPIYDIPAHPAIDAGELVTQLERQIAPFHAPRLLGRRVVGLSGERGAFTLTTDSDDTVRAKAVVVAAGAGAFGPNRPPLDELARYETSGAVQYYVRRREDLRGKRVVIAGGGDSAVDWALALKDIARVALVHRRRSQRTRALVQSGSDNSYGIYLAQVLLITIMSWLGWQHLNHYLPWPLVAVITVAVVFVSCIALTELLARTPLAKPLTGRTRVPWSRSTAAAVAPPTLLVVDAVDGADPDQVPAAAVSGEPATAAAMAEAIAR